MRSKIYQLVLMALMLVIPSRVDAQNYIIDAKERVQSADWSQMEIVTVKLTEFAYSPETLVFKEGIPYKLEIKNIYKMKGQQNIILQQRNFLKPLLQEKFNPMQTVK